MDNSTPFKPILKENYGGKKKRKKDNVSYVGYAEGGEVSEQTPNLSMARSEEIPAGLDQFLSSTPAQEGHPGTVGSAPQGLDKFLEPELKEEKYGTLKQQALAGLEGAAQGIAGPLAPLAEEQLGISPEDIRARGEVNPITHYVGEIGGLGAGLVSGMGEGALLAKAGETAANLAKLSAPVGTAAKIGSAAVKSAVENALFASSDEVSKAVLQDPNQSVEGTLADVGLSGVLGGAFGAGIGVAPSLWKATVGKDTHGLLHAISNRLGGIEGVIPDSLSGMIEKSGLDIPPEVKSALSDDPFIRHQFQVLQEGSTKSALKAQQAVKEFKEQGVNKILAELGRSPKEVEGLSDLSEFEAGKNVQKTLADQLKQSIEPISAKFENIKNKFSGEELSSPIKDKISEDIAKMADAEGYSKAPSSPQNALIQRTLKELPLQETLEDLRKYQSIISDSSFANPELRKVGQQIKGILRGVEDDVLEKAARKGKSVDVAEVAAARDSYKSAMKLIDDLNDRLHVGRFGGPSSFIKALKEMAPEDVLKRLNPKGDAGLLEHLQTTFPEVGDSIRRHELDKILRNSMMRAGDNQLISLKTLNNKIDALSPEMRNFLIPSESMDKIDAVQAIIKGLPEKMNTSGTAKTLDALWGEVPGSAIALGSILMGHGGIGAAALVVGKLAKTLGRDIPDAVRLSLLKFLGSNQPIEASGFRAMADYIDTAIKGQNHVNRAVGNLFKAGREVLPESLMPSEKDTLKLDKMLKEIQKNPDYMGNIGKDVMHYMPDHGGALISSATSASEFLNSIRPNSDPKLPLDPRTPISAMQKTAWERALKMAVQPLYVLDRIKDGSLTSKDVSNFTQLYPGVYKSLVTKLNNEMVDQISRGVNIPYKTRMGLSLFMAQPIDSTLSPEGIMAAQPLPAAPAPQQSVAPKKKGSPAALTKLSDNYKTNDQSLNSRRQRNK